MKTCRSEGTLEGRGCLYFVLNCSFVRKEKSDKVRPGANKYSTPIIERTIRVFFGVVCPSCAQLALTCRREAADGLLMRCC